MHEAYRDDRRGAIGKHLHVPFRLVGVAMLQMPPRRQQRSGGNGIAQSQPFQALRLGQRTSQQGHVAVSHPIRDATEAFSILITENGAASDGHAHAGVEQPWGHRSVAKNRRLLGEVGRESIHRSPSRR